MNTINSNGSNPQNFRIETNATGFALKIYKDGEPRNADLPEYISTPLDFPDVLPEVMNWVKGNPGRSLEISLPLTQELLASLMLMDGKPELVWHVQHTDDELHPVLYSWFLHKRL